MIAFLLAALALLEQIGPDIALVEGLKTAIAAEGVGTALAAIPLSDWLVLAEKLAAAAPEIQAAWAKLHPALAVIVADLEKGAAVAAANAHAFFVTRNNQPAEIPGYASDGSVGAVANPDAR